jgi:hypothetical protein
MDTAQSELERVAAPKQANSDAAALVGYFAALGLNVQTDAVNRLLVLLAVLVIECGGGLALAVGLSLSEHRGLGARKQIFAEQPILRRLDANPNAMRARRTTVEHPFGTIKARMGATHFLMKRLPRVATEMALPLRASRTRSRASCRSAKSTE